MPVAGTPCVGPAQGPRLAYVLSPDADDPGRRFTAADAAHAGPAGLQRRAAGDHLGGARARAGQRPDQRPALLRRAQTGHPVPPARARHRPLQPGHRAGLPGQDRPDRRPARPRGPARDRGHALRRLRLGLLQHQGGHAVERRGRAAVGDVHRGRALPADARLGQLLPAASGPGRDAPLLRQRRPRRPAGPVRAGVAGGGRALPRQRQRAGLRDLQRAQRLPGQALRPRARVRLRRPGQRAQVVRRRPSQRAPARAHRRDPVRRSHPRRLLRAQRGHGLRGAGDDRHHRAAALPAPGPGLPHLRPDPQAAGASSPPSGRRPTPTNPVGRRGSWTSSAPPTTTP